MEKSKLVNILKTFSKSELKEFEKFVSSPFFNKGRNFLPFLQQLTKSHPVYDSEKIKPEYLYSKTFPGKNFNKQIIWNQTSSLLKLAEEYLSHNALRKNKFSKLKSLALEFYDRGLSSYYLKSIKEMEKVTLRGGIDQDYLIRRVSIENEMITYHQLEDKQHLLCGNVLEKGKWTVLEFIHNIAGIICDLHSNQFMYNAVYDINLPYEFINNLELVKIIEFARNNNYEYTWLLEVYYHSMMSVIERKDPSHYFRLKSLFEKFSNSFSDSEKNKILTTLSNYCSLRINDGDDSFRRELFEISRIELREGLAFPDKKSSKITFIQMLRNAVFFDEIQWAKDFVEKYICKLPASHQKSMYALAYAFIHFRLKEQDKVLENLNKVKFIDVRDKLNVKSLLLRTYFEMRDINSLLYQIDSTRHFLNSNPSINPGSKANFMLFTSYINRFIGVMEKNDKLELELFKKSVEIEKTLINKGWFYEQIDELLKTFSRIS
jgi:hypothetical protein